jgi:hypothetical protein
MRQRLIDYANACLLPVLCRCHAENQMGVTPSVHPAAIHHQALALLQWDSSAACISWIQGVGSVKYTSCLLFAACYHLSPLDIGIITTRIEEL